MLNSLRYLVVHGLASAGYSSNVTAPLLNIFTMLDSELTMANFTLSDEIQAEFLKLDQGILMMNETDDFEDSSEDEIEEEEDDDDFDDDFEDDWDDDDNDVEDDDEF